MKLLNRQKIFYGLLVVFWGVHSICYGQTTPSELDESSKSESPPMTAQQTMNVTHSHQQTEHLFGRYRVQLAGNSMKFTEGQRCYEKLYGKPAPYYSLSGDWFPLDWWVNPGIMTKVGGYTARGKQARLAENSSDIVDCNSLEIDSASKGTLLFVPIQLGFKLEATPFRRKWFVIDVWSAAEYGWWQETRDSSTTTSSSKIYTNTGRSLGSTSGASIHLLLNPLDERTVRSMVNTMGLGYVYLTGFVENVTSRSPKGLTFGRRVSGLGFTFESYK